jgi:hypothetical protein
VCQGLVGVGHTVLGGVDEALGEGDGDRLARGGCSSNLLASVVGGVPRRVVVVDGLDLVSVVVSVVNSGGPKYSDETSGFVHGHGHGHGCDVCSEVVRSVGGRRLVNRYRELADGVLRAV